MELRYLLVADHAAVTDERKIVISGQWDVLPTLGFPVLVPDLYVVGRIDAQPSEGASGHRSRIILEDEAHSAVHPTNPAETELRFATMGPRLPFRADVLFRHFNVVFPQEGRYYFSIYVDGERLGSTGLWVVKRNVQA